MSIHLRDYATTWPDEWIETWEAFGWADTDTGHPAAIDQSVLLVERLPWPENHELQWDNSPELAQLFASLLYNGAYRWGELMMSTRGQQHMRKARP
jgi:hypothetical protein